jgi:hypothetical protein
MPGLCRSAGRRARRAAAASSFERWGRSHAAFRTACCWAAAADRRLPRGLRREVHVSVLSDAGEDRLQPVQIDGDNAHLPVHPIGLAAGAVRCCDGLRSVASRAPHLIGGQAERRRKPLISRR